MSAKSPKGYTTLQITLHWVVFLLVALQFIFADYISGAFRSLMQTGSFQPNALIFGHVFGGLLILALVIWRAAIKAKRGAPALPENEPRAMKITATATHHTLYLLLVLVPISGAVAWFGKVGPAGGAHELLKTLLMILILLHVAGALYQHYGLKTDVLKRMMKPEK